MLRRGNAAHTAAAVPDRARLAKQRDCLRKLGGYRAGEVQYGRFLANPPCAYGGMDRRYLYGVWEANRREVRFGDAGSERNPLPSLYEAGDWTGDSRQRNHAWGVHWDKANSNPKFLAS
ncbi:hypothetical protein Cenrod_1647 [Candidatus Symbiobacter mobilis CR]|uniref:Uncharacterized protein n=1 Tax=Candidatus Symbiobacter mobilis CR TaxID=946483 RepID=U5N8J8_9BURK|nr:hypothetical protein Cenrod_1647 [Candidatus Symbiobacter mobilis CR]